MIKVFNIPEHYFKYGKPVLGDYGTIQGEGLTYKVGEEEAFEMAAAFGGDTSNQYCTISLLSPYILGFDLMDTPKKLINVDVDKKTVTVDILQRYKNSLIEKFNDDVKEVLYNAIETGKVVRYTFNRRGIPAKSFVYDTQKEYIEVVIEPSQNILCYTDFDLKTIEKFIESEQWINEDFTTFLNEVGEEKFLKEIKDSMHLFQYQYKPEELLAYTKSLLNQREAL